MSEVLELISNYPTKYYYLNELTPYPSNYNQHPDSQIEELRESLETFGQFKPIVAWTCPKNETLPDGNELHEGLNYVICGHGLWQSSLRTSIDRLEAKDITGVSREMAEAILMVDNAAPLGSEPIPDKLASLLARTREITADRPGLRAMLDALKERAGVNGNGNTLGWDDAFGGLPSGDKSPFQQMTFTLHDSQMSEVVRALNLAKQLGDFADSPNENSNGNALNFICEIFITTNGQR